MRRRAWVQASVSAAASDEAGVNVRNTEASILMHRQRIRVGHEALAAPRFVRVRRADGDALFGFEDAL